MHNTFVISLFLFADYFNIVNNLQISVLLKKLDILNSEPLPIVLYSQSQSSYFDDILPSFEHSISGNLHHLLCRSDMMNHSGIIVIPLAGPNSSDVLSLLQEIDSITSDDCEFRGYHSKLFILLENPVMPLDLLMASFLAELSELFSSQEFSLNSDLYLIHLNDKEELRIHEFYQTNSHVVLQEIQPEKRFNFNWSQECILNQKRRFNLHGESIRSIIYKSPSFKYQRSIELTEDTLEELSIMFNYTNEFVESDGFISFTKNGTALYMAKQLLDGEGELLSQQLELSIERASKLHFIFPVILFREMIFFRQHDSFYTNLIFQPYSLETWALILIFLLLLAKSSQFIQRFRGIRSFHTLTYVYKIFAILTQQGGFEGCSSASALPQKFVLGSGLIFSLFLNTLYSASIVSIISTRKPAIQNYEQLLETSATIYGDYNARNIHYILNKVYPSEEQIDGKMTSTEEGILQHMSTSDAFVSFRHYIHRTMEVHEELMSFDDFCDNVSQIYLDSKGLPTYNGMYVRKHWPLRKLFFYGELRRGQLGLIKRQVDDFFQYYSPPCLCKVKDVEPLSLSLLSSIFILSSSIVLLAFVAFTIEIIHYNVWEYIKTPYIS